MTPTHRRRRPCRAAAYRAVRRVPVVCATVLVPVCRGRGDRDRTEPHLGRRPGVPLVAVVAAVAVAAYASIRRIRRTATRTTPARVRPPSCRWTNSTAGHSGCWS
ncbi:hypothetical protein E4K10_26955 [Streptomyces sp. T1317-0309]|nr:hypothetical protein E4K10_26955 [Streptomyces sp. T1317-0309]